MTDNSTKNTIKIGVLIATSMNRNKLLFDRSLKSVLNQTAAPDCILVVDDNDSTAISNEIEQSLLPYRNQNVFYSKNLRTKGHSGTGSWNTGIDWMRGKLGDDGYIAILDDDDEWQSSYINDCKNMILSNSGYPDAIFCYLHRTDCHTPSCFTTSDLTVDSFLVSNPGVQGSNMFFKISVLAELGGFDENLDSCTDRDIMIRFIEKYGVGNVAIFPEVRVRHFAGAQSLTYDKDKKRKGLNKFYIKHINRYKRPLLEKSLERAERLFGFSDGDNVRKIYNLCNLHGQCDKIVMGVAIHNGADTIRKCLESILCQEGLKRQLWVVVADDCSTDNWKDNCADLLASDMVIVIDLYNANVAKTRNDINEFISKIAGKFSLVGRLDCDDELSDKLSLSKIETRYDEKCPDAILTGNYQVREGKVQDFVNVANRELSDMDYLLSRLKSMSEGDTRAELASCNLFLTPNTIHEKYPDVRSAEDHYLLVRLLLSGCKIELAEDIISCNYNISGNVTSENKESSVYIDVRRKLYDWAKKTIENKKIINNAQADLSVLSDEEIQYLGRGCEGIVFHDSNSVFKALIPKKVAIKETKDFKTFYADTEIVLPSGVRVQKYQYEKSEPVKSFSEKDAIDFLTDCWRSKTIFLDCKKENFVRVGDQVKLIDFSSPKQYDDNLFLNLCARMFVFVHEYSNPDLMKLRCSLINNFGILEGHGLREFVNRVFVNIIFEESKSFSQKYAIDIRPDFVYEFLDGEVNCNFQEMFFGKLKQGLYLRDIQISDLRLTDKNTVAPKTIAVGYQKLSANKNKVSLLIKTCAMETETIEQNVKHIVRQLCFPVPFHEIVLSIDCKTDDFLRQYTKAVDLEKIVAIAESLKAQNVIDRYFVYDHSETARVNMDWFGLCTSESHSSRNIPVSSQLYAFEQCNGDYIMQMDSDVMIGRTDYCHDYQNDMIEELKKNPNVVSVGFNIPNLQSNDYYGFGDGGFVPEVRMCMLDKKRLLSLRPFPNQLDEDGKLQLSWYRSIEQFQKTTGYCSIRGGDRRSFFIHPQNYRKTKAYSWMNILDRVEQNQIPELQYGHFDCEGSYREWCGPKRSEEMVVVSCFRNIAIDRFLRMWCSLMSQTIKDFGVILYDDCSDNGCDVFIRKIIEPFADRVTFVASRSRGVKIQNERTAISCFCDNPNSIIVLLDADDSLIGTDVLYSVYKKYKYYSADVTCGKVHQTYRIQPHYRYPVNFLNPRKTGGNVWQHLKTFRKYLFDSIPLNYFKYDNRTEKLSEESWIEKCDDFAIMVPIIEMSKSPFQMDFINYYYERDYEKRNADRELKERCIAEVLTKPPLADSNVQIGRKCFRPLFDKIELDITYQCNLRCEGCNRLCNVRQDSKRLELSDIKDFISQSIKHKISWKLINVLGGEPTLHSDFVEIVKMIQEDYADKFNPNVIIQVVSNGVSEKSRELCEKVVEFKNVRIDRASFKTTNKIEYFSPFADAPIDDADFSNADYSKACWVAEYCGLSLTPYGYYGCALCGAIDRFFGSKLSVKELSQLTNAKIIEQFRSFCKYCGNYKHYEENRGDFVARCEKAPFRNVVSETWQKLYNDYKQYGK